MSELATVEFRYDDLPVADRRFLKDKVGAIRLLARQCAESVLHIGRHLNEVRERIGRVGFTQWVDTEFAWDIRHAHRMMDAAEVFGSVGNGQIVGRFDASALYVLSAPSAPPQAREFAVDMARDGDTISHKIAKGIVAGLKANPDLSAADVKKYFRERPPEPLDTTSEPDDVFTDYKLLWRAFRQLIHANYSVTFTWEPHNIDDQCDSVPEDPETHLRKALFKAEVYNIHTARPKVFASTTHLENLILDATDSHPMQKCSGPCQRTLRLYEEFSAKKGNRFNRSRACKKCEVKRVGAYKKEKKGEVAPS